MIMKKMKDTKGVTLIALAVSIVVLLILTGITVRVMTGDEGIITLTQQAKENQLAAQEEAQLKINSLKDETGVVKEDGTIINDTDAPTINSAEISDITTSGFTVSINVTETGSGLKSIEYSIDGGNTYVKGDLSDTETSYSFTGLKGGKKYSVKVKVSDNNSNYAEIVKTAKTAKTEFDIKSIIPTGYYYVGGTLDTGIVISDTIEDENRGDTADTASFVGNQWVWVPVEDASTMFETGTYTLLETSITTNLYSKSAIISGITRTTPGRIASPYYREPDVLSSYDTSSSYYSKILGFSSTEAMAQAFVDDYKAMKESIDTYGGFYIGRYELTGSVASPTEKPGATLVGTNWYNLYKACRTITGENNTYVQSSMIWGCQWDVTCNWLASSGYNITDSTSWGNYKNSTVTANDGTTLKASGTSKKLNTGETTYTKANNIYDIAGNCTELTQEAYTNDCRASRGGRYLTDGSVYPASYRGSDGPRSSSTVIRR